MATASSPSPPVARSTTWFHGTSAAVSTATTPGSARAADTFMAAILADGMSARTTLPWSMPGSCQSAAYSSDPSTLSTKSWCAGLCPTTRSVAWRAGASVSGMAAGPLRGLCGVFLDRVQDLAVAGAAAQVADQLAADPLAARPRVALQERPGGEQHAGRAEAALRGAVAQEARLQGVEIATRGQAAHGHERAAVGLHREQQAAADRLAVEQHRAGPAHPLAAAVADLVVAEVVPEHVEEAVVREHPGLPLLAVDRERDGLPSRLAHRGTPLGFRPTGGPPWGPPDRSGRTLRSLMAPAFRGRVPARPPRRAPAGRGPRRGVAGTRRRRGRRRRGGAWRRRGPPSGRAAPPPAPRRAYPRAPPPGRARDARPRRRTRPNRRRPSRRRPAPPRRPRPRPSSRSCGGSAPGTTSRCATRGWAHAPRRRPHRAPAWWSGMTPAGRRLPRRGRRP